MILKLMRTMLLLLILLLAACGAAPSAGSPTTTPTAAATAIAETTAPTAAATIMPAPTTAPLATAAPSSDGTEPPYLDDRSNAEALINSFYNAINRKEYARAYAYWQPGTAELPPYQAFEHGYSMTSAVQVAYGTVTGDIGAGQTRFSVPVSITSDTNAGTQYFFGCYMLHLASPAAQATLPFRPLAIESAAVQQSSSVPMPNALTQACQGQGSPVPAPAESDSIDQSVYLDNMSDPVDVLRSFYNAINRHEYLRAYSYWQDQSQLLPLPAFTQGYSTTQSVALATEPVQSEAGAGQRYYRVPVTITSQLSDGSIQMFAGCYFLHFSSPAIQAPPFQPLGIDAANIQPVTSSASAPDLMSENCRVSR